MTKKEIALEAVKALKEEYPDALCSLHADNPLELLIATRLSAQCTDARVNLVTPALFAKYPTLEDYCNAQVEDVEKLIIPAVSITEKRGILLLWRRKSAMISAEKSLTRWRGLPLYKASDAKPPT